MDIVMYDSKDANLAPRRGK